MSYAFDTLVQVWRKRVNPHIEDRDLATLFEMLFEEMHDANHEMRDAVNKALGVTRSARELQAHDRELDEQRVASVKVQTVRRNEDRVALDLTGFQVKSLLLSLGREIKKRTRRLEKMERKGLTFVPEPGHRNIEVLTLQRHKEAYDAIRSQVQFEMWDGWNKDKLPEGASDE